MGLLARGQAMLTRSLKDTAGQTITYTRGAESVTLTAWPGETLFALSAPTGAARVAWGDADWLIEAADLVIGGQAIKPLKGDRVSATINGEACAFEVATPTGETPWRWSDHMGRTRIRAHTKRVA